MDTVLINYLQQLNSELQAKLDKQEQEKAKQQQEWLSERQAAFDRVLAFVPEPLRPYCTVNAERYGNKNEYPVIIRIPEHTTLYADAYIGRWEPGEKLRVVGGGYYDQADTDVATVVSRAKREWADLQADREREAHEAARPEPAPCAPSAVEQMRACLAAHDMEGARFWAEIVKAEALHSLAARGDSF